MLIQMDNSVITKHWEEIKRTLRVNLLPFADADDNALNNILQSMLIGDMQVWAIIDEDKILGLGVTQFLNESASQTLNLLIYSLYGYSFISQDVWADAIEKLKVYAKSKGCSNIIAYSKVGRVIEIAESIGANTELHLINWRL